MLNREQLALASQAERERALLSERQVASREAARKARERALYGSASAKAAARARVLPLVRDDVVEDYEPPEGVVGND